MFALAFGMTRGGEHGWNDALTLTAVQGVANEQAGVASAMLNTSQQIGATLGVSLLATFSTLTANAVLRNASTVLQQGLAAGDTSLIAKAGEVLAQGYTTAFLAGAALLVAAAAIVAVVVNT